jgi:hypothetical protein
VISGLPWVSRTELERHFKKHGREVGAGDIPGYLHSARETIRVGVRFTYRWKARYQVGYYHPGTRKFVALTADADAILTHYVESEKRVRGLPESTYR